MTSTTGLNATRGGVSKPSTRPPAVSDGVAGVAVGVGSGVGIGVGIGIGIGVDVGIANLGRRRCTRRRRSATGDRPSPLGV